MHLMQPRILLLMAALVSADADRLPFLIIPTPAPTPFPAVQACPAGQARTSHYTINTEAGTCGENNITTIQDCNTAFAALNSRGAFSWGSLRGFRLAGSAHLISTGGWPTGCNFARTGRTGWDLGSSDWHLYFNINANFNINALSFSQRYRYDTESLCTGCGAPTPAPPTLLPTPAPTPVPCPAGQARHSWVLTTGRADMTTEPRTGDGTCGNATITTVKECDAVAAALNVGQRTSWTNQTTAVSISTSYRPHGCALIEGDRLYFNQEDDTRDTSSLFTPCNPYNYKCLCSSACRVPTPAPTPAPPTRYPTPAPTPASAPAWCPTGQVRKSWVLTAGTCGSATITTVNNCSAAAYALGYAASVPVGSNFQSGSVLYPSGCVSLTFYAGASDTYQNTYFRHVDRTEGARQIDCGSGGAECICSACVTPDDPLILPLAASLAAVFVASAAILIRRTLRRRRAANENEDVSDATDGDLASRPVIESMVEKTVTQETTSAAVL